MSNRYRYGELVEIDVSVLAEDEHTFISGFKLVYTGGTPSIHFGYQILQKQIKIELRSQQLTGFQVFAGDGRIQAIRPIFDQSHGICHSTIGNPKATCQPVLLIPDGKLKALAGDFDLCRMVGLGLGTSLRPRS
ncbi:uncharacterized protein N7483_009153 [Penicillium malachiteum]|uniref:uncharacterized protein n=1 Tax=Penicillium malachiteum TaxID=1324776 RepID=UPI002546EB14|nr:uncharacterized protein N7483_009153 [Penicillium malachiteum]KAJ5721219.1 hypothetical protein N7483_009153 [Penicillium malachiteum]